MSPRKLNSGFGEEEKGPGDQVPEHEVPSSTKGKPRSPESPVSSGRLLGAPEAEAVLTFGPLRWAASGPVSLGREPWTRILEIWVPVSLLDLSKSLSCLCHLWNGELVRVEWGRGTIGGGRTLESGQLGPKSCLLRGFGQVT